MFIFCGRILRKDPAEGFSMQNKHLWKDPRKDFAEGSAEGFCGRISEGSAEGSSRKEEKLFMRSIIVHLQKPVEYETVKRNRGCPQDLPNCTNDPWLIWVSNQP